MQSAFLTSFFACLLIACTVQAQVTEQFITTRDGLQLYTMYVPAATKKAKKPTLIWLHGFAQHSYRAGCAMEYMSRCGYASIGYDARGHGASEGMPGYLADFDISVCDLVDVYKAYKKCIKGPVILIAHSLGGLTAARAAEIARDDLCCKMILLTSPFFGPNCATFSLPKQHILKALAAYVPTLAIPINTFAYQFTHDVAVAQAARLDACVGKVITPGGFVQAMRAATCALHQASCIATPINILASGDDTIVDLAKTAEFFSCVPARYAKNFKVYPGLYHSLLDEVGREQIFQDICCLCDQYC